MAKVTIYLSDAVEKKVRKAAKASKQPVSRWIADQLARTFEDKWPDDFLAAAGSMPDIVRSREVEQSVLDILDGPSSR